jgi:hypothetical protein
MEEEITTIPGWKVLPFVLLLVTACGRASTVASARSHPITRVSPVPWCVAPGSKVDSTFAVAQARSLFTSSELPLKPHSVEPVVARLAGKDSSVSLSFPEGWLVRLMPVEPNTLGGGGLVWVDGATGCPILLLHYE